MTGWVDVDEEDEDDELGVADHPELVFDVVGLVVGVVVVVVVVDFAVEVAAVRLEALAEVDAADEPIAICAPIPTNAVTLSAPATIRDRAAACRRFFFDLGRCFVSISELLRKLRFVLTKAMLGPPADAPLRPA